MRDGYQTDSTTDEEYQGQIRCMCNRIEDDGFTIQCEKCFTWQHAVCVGVTKNNIPVKYFCSICSDNNGGTFLWIEKSVISDPFVYKILQQLSDGMRKLSSKEGTLYSSSLELVRIFNRSIDARFPPYLFLRPLKSRGYQKKSSVTRYAVHTSALIPPGTIICELVGEIRVKDSFANIPSIILPQTFYFFVPNMNIVVDSNSKGNNSRYFRRSCRPNTLINIYFTGDSLSVVVLSKNSIQPNEEIFLANDFEYGNRTFRYHCACGNPEYCLSSCLYGSFQFNNDGIANYQPGEQLLEHSIDDDTSTVVDILSFGEDGDKDNLMVTDSVEVMVESHIEETVRESVEQVPSAEPETAPTDTPYTEPRPVTPHTDDNPPSSNTSTPRTKVSLSDYIKQKKQSQPSTPVKEEQPNS